MEHFYKNTVGENWFNYPELYSYVVDKFPTGSHFVEVGTWKGRSACYMAVEIINSSKAIVFDCVDTWAYIPSSKEISQEECVDVYDTFLKNILPVRNNINIVRKLSWEGAINYTDQSLDFVFIDAGHDYLSVIKDLNAWYPKVKKNGVIAGHDYHTSKEVKKAVEEFFNHKHTVIDKSPCWYVDLLN